VLSLSRRDLIDQAVDEIVGEDEAGEGRQGADGEVLAHLDEGGVRTGSG